MLLGGPVLRRLKLTPPLVAPGRFAFTAYAPALPFAVAVTWAAPLVAPLPAVPIVALPGGVPESVAVAVEAGGAKSGSRPQRDRPPCR